MNHTSEDREFYLEFAAKLSDLNASQREQTIILKSINEKVDYLNKVVIHGNGNKPLITRVEVIETRILDNAGKIHEISEQVDKVELEKAKLKRNSVIMMAGVLSVAGIVIFDYINHTEIASWFLKNVFMKSI